MLLFKLSKNKYKVKYFSLPAKDFSKIYQKTFFIFVGVKYSKEKDFQHSLDGRSMMFFLARCKKEILLNVYFHCNR